MKKIFGILLALTVLGTSVLADGGVVLLDGGVVLFDDGGVVLKAIAALTGGVVL